jgi:hypothetical protein
MDDKLIITNRSALTAKYGAAGLAKIRQAVKALVAADAKRGLRSRLVFLDDAKAMEAAGGTAVAAASDPQQNKAAIDALFKASQPEYLMILGAIDVVPHQDLHNPLFHPTDDPDRYAFGDLPYACDAPYSRDIATFKGPTRVLGRLPDLTGATEPSHLLALLGQAAAWRSRPPADYGTYFGLSALVWQASTAESLGNIFGNATAMKTSPPSGPKHGPVQLAARSHFINCHGGMADPVFYGEGKDRKMPQALTSDGLAGKISAGTVASVECCYGAELYDSVTLALPLPICQQYLRQGAHGFFGSSTIAYGPPSGNGAADLVTQYFLADVLRGASLGRAALEARQRFVQDVAELDPVDLKTLAQFSLLGDPSVHPVAVPTPTQVPKSMQTPDAQRQQRRERRAKLQAMGEFLDASKPTASRRVAAPRSSPTVRQALANIARQAGLDASAFSAFAVRAPSGTPAARAKAQGMASRYHVAVRQQAPKTAQREGLRVAVVAKEVNGRIVGYRIYLER